MSKVEISNNYFGFRFFDRTVTVVDGEMHIGDREDISGWYYHGEKMTLQQVEETFGNNRDYEILISNMRGNNVGAVARSKLNQFVPLNDNDKII